MIYVVVTTGLVIKYKLNGYIPPNNPPEIKVLLANRFYNPGN